MEGPLRILLVDRSPRSRQLLRTLLEQDGDISVVGEAVDGLEALRLAASLQPDLLIIEVGLGPHDALETTRQIMAYHPTPILILSSAATSQVVDLSFELLGAGALDVIRLPDLAAHAEAEVWRRTLLRRAKLLAGIRVVTHLRGRRGSARQDQARPQTSAKANPQLSAHPFPVVVIGASTGGPKAVRQLLAGLPGDFPCAVLLVQHIAEGFGAGMAAWLAGASTLPVRLASEGTLLEPGLVLVAPERFDVLVRTDGRIHLSGLPLLLQRPAIDIAMQSVAAVFGAATMGVLLTGMGRDGAVGMQAIRRAGGYTIAQDEASCVIYGMPRAAVELAAVDAVLAPAQIAAALAERCARARDMAL